MRRLGMAAVLMALGGCSTAMKRQPSSMPPPDNPFARAVIDIGVVCSDVAKSLDFYKQVLGFTEVGGFDVSAAFGGDTGLSDYEPFHVHVLQLVDDKNATRLKLMQFPNKPGKKTDQSFIHSSYGYSYITIFVKDLSAMNERLQRHGVSLLGKCPVQIGDGPNHLTLVKDPDGNFIELIGPLTKGKNE